MVKIGIEVHIQLESCKSKLFCGCPTLGSELPNTRVCETCLGLPGSKPLLNKKAIIEALKVALALNCKINQRTFFSRKSYFYPDLPKNYQITQYELPLAVNGQFDNINIKRIHLEEDPGRLVHENNITLIDYNRSSIPLIEIVTEPDFKSAVEVRVFLQKLTTILEYLGVYTRKSEASLRTDANVSTTGARVEIKNINGIKDVEKALNSEIERQLKQKIKIQETRSWNPESGTTILTRTKETEEDYGYITEADLPEIEIFDKEIKEIREQLPELADQKVKRLVKELKIKEADARALAADILLVDLFEKASKKVDPKLAAKWLRRELPRVLHYNKKTLREVEIDENYIIELLILLEKKEITDNVAQKILEKLIEKPFSPREYIKKEKLTRVFDEKNLEEICKKVVKENEKAVKDYKAGEEKASHFLIGKIMAYTKGAAEPEIINKLLKRILKDQ